jgi:hypothetical protein
MIVPVRASGAWLYLEASAQAISTVTTTVELASIEARPGEEVLAAARPPTSPQS